MPLHELVPLYGPIAAEAAAARAPVGLYFEARLAKLGAEAASIIEVMAEWLKADKTFPEVVIEGHSDRLEPQAPQLSLSRASAVRDALTHLGVPSSKLRVQGLGSDHPLSLANRACNRRAEVHLRGKRAG
ncbi:pal [Symbiodinium natans]|uniref:Pal protein n=1 Tax=Symbiodinium natans TaxID=878477 RepID=A0A812UTI6_9DINO|nr:pal [Symbiodinium natans]